MPVWTNEDDHHCRDAAAGAASGGGAVADAYNNKKGDDDDDVMRMRMVHDFPCWSRVVCYLSTLSELLSLRLVCRGWHGGLNDQLSASQLANAWLAPALQHHRAYLLGGAGQVVVNMDRQWHHATNQGRLLYQHRSNDDDDDEYNENHQDRSSSSSSNNKKEDVVPTLTGALRTASSSPLELFLAILRVLNSLPMEMAVAFSGKYGRQIIPLCQPNNNNNHTPVGSSSSSRMVLEPHYYWTRCTRNSNNTKNDSKTAPPGRGGTGSQNGGGGGCPTCRYPIPTRSSRFVNNNNNSKDGNDEEDVLHRHFAIQVQGGRVGQQFLDLRECHPKCLGTLPQTLHCPYGCGGSDQQKLTRKTTLILSDFCYESEPGTEKPESHQMSLTFTPLQQQQQQEQEQKEDDGNDDKLSFASLPTRPSKRAKQERLVQKKQQQQEQKLLQQQQAQERIRRKTRPAALAVAQTKQQQQSHCDDDDYEHKDPYFCESETKKKQTTFPPRYREMCVPGLPQEHVSNAKYGVTIYCTACRKFAILAPAGLCHSHSRHHSDLWLQPQPDEDDDDQSDNKSHSSDSQQHQQQWTLPPPRPRVEPPFVIGGMLQRRMCRNNNCSFTCACSICRPYQQRQQQSLTTSSPNGDDDFCLTCRPLDPSAS